MKTADWLDVAAGRDLIRNRGSGLRMRTANQRPPLPTAHSGVSIMTDVERRV